LSSDVGGGAEFRAWDVFVSYKKRETERARALVEALEREGFSIWWDRRIPPGETWPRIIEMALDTSSAVVPLWTQVSVEDVGGWVHIEARRASRRGALVPVLVDPVEPPLEFSSIQAADLTAWNGDSASGGFEDLVGRLRALVDADERPTRTAEQVKVDVAKRRRADRRRKIVGITAPVVGALAWLAIASTLLLTHAPTTSVVLEDMTVDGVRITVGDRPVERNEIPVGMLIVSADGDLESVRMNVPGEGSVRVYPEADYLAFSGGGPSSTLIIDAQDYAAGSLLEIQRDDEDLRLTSPPAERRSLRVTGPWNVRVGRERMSLDFGDRGGVEIVSSQPLFLDFQPPVGAGEVTLVERAAITDAEFSDFVLFDRDGGATPTIVSGTLSAGGGAVEALNSSSALGWDAFEGTLSRLWLEGGALRAELVGNTVSGLRLDGVRLMPTRFASFAPTSRMLVMASMGLALAAILVGFARLARRAW
jgi:hypothetical protein